MRKRFEQKRELKSREISSALEVSEASILRDYAAMNDGDNCITDSHWFTLDGVHHSAEDNDSTPALIIDWKKLPSPLNPSHGELNTIRSIRKRQQIESMLVRFEELLSRLDRTDPLTVVDFGAGSGHLGLLLGYLYPHFKIILAERKEYSVAVARSRITECGITNVAIYCGDARNIGADFCSSFDIAVSLHSCGHLTDIILNLCAQMHSSFVLVPCCYGQLAKPPPALNTGTVNIISDAAATEFKSCLCGESIFRTISSAAEFATHFSESEDAFETVKSHFFVAKRCMRVIDYDRCVSLAAANPSLSFKLASLSPLTCSPKNNVLIGVLTKDSKGDSHRSSTTYMRGPSASHVDKTPVLNVSKLNDL
jgi:SAM-dependent methyltransferase